MVFAALAISASVISTVVAAVTVITTPGRTIGIAGLLGPQLQMASNTAMVIRLLARKVIVNADRIRVLWASSLLARVKFVHERKPAFYDEAVGGVNISFESFQAVGDVHGAKGCLAFDVERADIVVERLDAQ